MWDGVEVVMAQRARGGAPEPRVRDPGVGSCFDKGVVDRSKWAVGGVTPDEEKGIAGVEGAVMWGPLVELVCKIEGGSVFVVEPPIKTSSIDIRFGQTGTRNRQASGCSKPTWQVGIGLFQLASYSDSRSTRASRTKPLQLSTPRVTGKKKMGLGREVLEGQ